MSLWNHPILQQQKNQNKKQVHDMSCACALVVRVHVRVWSAQKCLRTEYLAWPSISTKKENAVRPLADTRDLPISKALEVV